MKNVLNEINMTLYDKYEIARNNFMHFALRTSYGSGDGFRKTDTFEERKYCCEMANKWDKIIKELREKIIQSASSIG